MTSQIEDTLKTNFFTKVWADEGYRTRLQDDPKAALVEMGASVPDRVDIRCVMDTDKVKYLRIPEAPPEGEISEEDLTAAQGGTTLFCGVTMIAASMSV